MGALQRGVASTLGTSRSKPAATPPYEAVTKPEPAPVFYVPQALYKEVEGAKTLLHHAGWPRPQYDIEGREYKEHLERLCLLLLRPGWPDLHVACDRFGPALASGRLGVGTAFYLLGVLDEDGLVVERDDLRIEQGVV